MLVRKINEDWKPSENPELEVGDVIEITDAEALIRQGLVEEVVEPEKTSKKAKEEVVEPAE